MTDDTTTQAATPDEEPIQGHVYDGIREYDNPLPGWWKLLFWATIVFCVPYTIWYHFMEGNDIYDQYEADVAAAAAGESEERLSDDTATLVRLMNDEQAMEQASAGFQSRCSACHTADGGGVPALGANLTDDHWINVDEIGDIVGIIENGVSGTAMVGMKNVMSHNEIVRMAAYVASLRGTTPENPREPQGEEIPPWPTLEEVGAAGD